MKALSQPNNVPPVMFCRQLSVADDCGEELTFKLNPNGYQTQLKSQLHRSSEGKSTVD